MKIYYCLLFSLIFAFSRPLGLAAEAVLPQPQQKYALKLDRKNKKPLKLARTQGPKPKAERTEGILSLIFSPFALLLGLNYFGFGFSLIFFAAGIGLAFVFLGLSFGLLGLLGLIEGVYLIDYSYVYAPDDPWYNYFRHRRRWWFYGLVVLALVFGVLPWFFLPTVSLSLALLFLVLVLYAAYDMYKKLIPPKS